MKKAILRFCLVMPAVLSVVAAPGAGEAQPEMDDFYGSKNIQTITLHAMPFMMEAQGAGGELFFGFNTLSKKSEFAESWKNYYGVGIGGGYILWTDSEIADYDHDRDASVLYGLLRFEGKLYYRDTGKVRPYLGGHLGLGYGSWGVERMDGDPEIPTGSLTTYQVGGVAGLNLDLGGNYWLNAGVGVDFRSFKFGMGFHNEYPPYLVIGVTRWTGPL